MSEIASDDNKSRVIPIQQANTSSIVATRFARPARGIVLVSVDTEMPWATAFSVAIRNQCAAWGGSGNLILPLNSDSVDEPLFWAILSAHDPDFVILGDGCLADYADLAPGAVHKQKDALRTEPS